MAGKTNGAIAYSTEDVEVMKNAFGVLVVAVQQQMEESIKVWEQIAKNSEPFTDDTTQKASFNECYLRIDSLRQSLVERFTRADKIMGSCLEKFEAAMRTNNRYAEQAAQAVAQATAKAQARQAN